jgi:hypothetical protein
VHDPELPLDPERDAWVLALIPRVLARGMPLLAICRGTQEANVALGGSLHQAVHEVPGLLDHDVEDDAPAAEQYGPAHRVDVVSRAACSSASPAPAASSSIRCMARASSGWPPACAWKPWHPTAWWRPSRSMVRPASACACNGTRMASRGQPHLDAPAAGLWCRRAPIPRPCARTFAMPCHRRLKAPGTACTEP